MEEPKVAIVGRGENTSRLAAALAMSMAIPFYMHPDDMPFGEPYSRQTLEPPVAIETDEDRERLQKAVEKRERKRLKALRDLGR